MAEPGRHARLSDVADAAGVSAQTVSNVLNGRGGFTESTRQRVLAAADALQFRPNLAARQLRTRRSRQLGLHLPSAQLSVRNAFTVSFLRAVIEATERAEHQLVVFTHPVDDAALRTGLLTSGLDGFVLYNIAPGDHRPALLAAANLPFAVFGRISEHLPQSWVDIDNAAAMAQVVDHLVGRGHRTFGYLGFDEPEYWNADRLRGTRERLAQHGLRLGDSWTLIGGSDAIRAQLPRLLTGRRPDAIICSSDRLALFVHQAAQRQGIRLGHDLAVTGFDGLPLASELDPPLTSVALPLEAAADAVVRLVLSQLAGDPAPESGTVLPTELAIGGTA